MMKLKRNIFKFSLENLKKKMPAQLEKIETENFLIHEAWK